MLLTNKYYISEVINMSRNAKSDQVIRRVVLGREYEIYSMSFKGGQPSINLLETVTLDKRPTETEMIEKYKVEKVMIVPKKVITGYYGVPIDKFMELATLVEKKEKALTEDEKEEDLQPQQQEQEPTQENA
jgi:hypothetical protein